MTSLISIELRHLRYFIAASEHCSFRKAAAALGVCESAISRRVRDLEDRLGTSLFRRHPGGVDLTPAGQQFLRRARKALQQIEHGAKDVAAIGRVEEGQVNIGIFSSLASGFLFDLLSAYKKDHPGIRVNLIEGDPAEHIAAIRQHRLDVAFITGRKQWPDCETEHLWVERVFVVLPDDHSLADKDHLDWPDLAGHTFMVSDAAPGPEIHDYLVRRLADLGYHPEIKQQYVGRDSLLSFVPIERYLTITSEATTAAQLPGVTFRPVINETLPFSAIWSLQNSNPACRKLLSLARKMSKSASQC